MYASVDSDEIARAAEGLSGQVARLDPGQVPRIVESVAGAMPGSLTARACPRVEEGWGIAVRAVVDAGQREAFLFGAASQRYRAVEARLAKSFGGGVL